MIVSRWRAYEDGSLARRPRASSTPVELTTSLSLGLEQRPICTTALICGLVLTNSSLAGQIAAVESRLAVAVLTQCSVPEGLDILGREHGLGPLDPMQVAVHRSKVSLGEKPVDMLHGLLVRTLRSAPAV